MPEDAAVLVRSMSESDVDFVSRLLADELRAPVEGVRRQVAHCQRQSPALCFVALVDGETVGALLASHTGLHVVLDALVVRDDGRHRGVRRALHESFARACARGLPAPIVAHVPLKDAPVFHHLGYRVPDALFLVNDSKGRD